MSGVTQTRILSAKTFLSSSNERSRLSIHNHAYRSPGYTFPRICTSRHHVHRSVGVCATRETELQDNSEALEDYQADEAQEEYLQRILAFISSFDKLAPYDAQIYNPALILWKHVKKLSPESRLRLLDELDFRGINKLWEISQRLMTANPEQMLEAAGPDYSLMDEFPHLPGEAVVLEGRASAPVVGLLGLDRFQKAFFRRRSDSQLMGRVLLNRGFVGDLLYPLYFSVDIQRAILPSTGEAADLSLSYLEPGALRLSREDLPEETWPSPGKHRFPFGDGLVDYVRPVGPGVLVGCGWKESPSNGLSSERFLTFVLVNGCRG